MSECANCNVSVYVPDGYDFEEGDLCTSCLNDKVDRLQALVDSADEPNGSMMWTSDHDKILARQEEQWKTWGIVEIAVRNPSVSEYMSHWEGRATKAEAENDKLRGLLAKSDLDCVYCGLPKRDMGRCYFGFPGCGRADDLMLEANDGPKPEPTV